MAVKKSQAEEALEQRISMRRESFRATAAAQALAEVQAGARRASGARRGSGAGELPSIRRRSSYSQGQSQRRHKAPGSSPKIEPRSSFRSRMHSITEVDLSGGGGLLDPVRRPSIAQRAMAEIKEIAEHAKEVERERKLNRRGSRPSIHRKGSFAAKQNQFAIPRIHELCEGKPMLLAEMQARIAAGEDAKLLLVQLKREREEEVKVAKLEAEMAAKQARQEEKEQRGVRDVQRAWLRALWIPRCLHELLACVPRGKGRRAAATAIQRKWRRHYLRKLTKKHTGFMNAVLGVAWFLKLQVRSKRRANSANAARRFVQCYITRAVLFRITVQTFRKRVLTGQRLARSWLACQAARRAVLCRLWKRIGMRKIEQIIAKRGTERRRSLDRSKQDQDAQDAAAVARRRGAKEGAGAEDRPFDHKYSNFQRFLRQTMQEIDQADSTANDSPERKAALKGLRRRRNSVVLFGHARDVLIADALKRWRRVHVAKHAVEHNSNKRIYDADFHAGCALDVSDLRAAGGIDQLFAGKKADKTKPVWPMLLLYSAIAQDHAFLAQVEETVENAMNEYETDRFKAHAGLDEYHSASQSNLAPTKGGGKR